jgi:FkbM family methyltransferase
MTGAELDDPGSRKAERRRKRALRRARAQGLLDGAAAMLRPGDLALDCGANLGEVTRVLAATGADVIAYEPDPWCLERLSERFAGHPNVTLVSAAVGTAEGRAQLLRAGSFDTNPKGASLKSTLLPGARAMDDTGTVEVAVVDLPARIREFAEERGEVALLKLDVEGAELAILGALLDGDLLRHVRCLLAETHERKFKDLRPAFRDLRRRIAQEAQAGRVHLDWM